MRDRRRSVSQLLASIAIVMAFGACSPEQPTPPTVAPVAEVALLSACEGLSDPDGTEGEIFGSIYENGERKCTAESDVVELIPDAETAARLHWPFGQSLVANSDFRHMFEWWDPEGGGPCTGYLQTTVQWFQSGSTEPETPHASGSQEIHCVRPGRYQFSGGTREFPVDYVQIAEDEVTLQTGGTASVETTEYVPFPTYYGSWYDLIIMIDNTSTTASESAVLDIENAGPIPYKSTFAGQAGSVVGTAEDWFRFSSSRSTSSWSANPQGHALMRLYFDGADTSQATGYYSDLVGTSLIRLHRYPNPVTATRQYTVGLEVLRPDELPANEPNANTTRTITINRINPDLAAGTVTAPSSGTIGGGLTISIQERNLGTSTVAPVEAGWTGKVYLSTDAVLSPATDVLVSTYTEGIAIAAGQSFWRTMTFNVPSNLTPGTYRVIVSLDANATVLESSEANNVGVSGPVSITAPPFTVTINGPTLISMPGTYQWSASTGPAFDIASYAWYRRPDGGSESLVSTGWKYVRSITPPEPNFRLRVVVTNTLGQVARDTVFVNVAQY
jgi:hypothetical protein